MLGHFHCLCLPKSNRFQASRSSSYQIRGSDAKIGPHFKKIVVIGFAENVKNVGWNNAIHHFDMCGMSIFPQSHFSFRQT